ncbi:hypothetical protein PHISP_08105 [Aspergillus sp. HF37]|nr:hypothetical protein PHISP_08105 [Aspergillus sp. HF37]
MIRLPAPSPPTKLTILETVDIVYKLTKALLGGAAAAVKFPFLGDRAAKRYRTHITHAVLRKLSSQTTVRQSQVGSTTASYEKYAKSRGITPRTVSWETGHGHWIGDSDATKVLVWFHGGGYYAPASTAHFRFLEDVVHAVCQSGKEKGFAAFVPSYTLAPHARYPAQLHKGLEVLQYLVQGEGKALKNIVIGGDSAGGNLVLGILSHMSHPHPHPDLAEFDPESSTSIAAGSLRGALLLSPWVSNDRSWASVQRNGLKDCVTTVPTDISAEHFLADDGGWDNYNEPIRAPEGWWADIKCRNMLIVSGEDEIMTDAHKAFGRTVQAASPGKTEIAVAPGEGHAAPILDLMLGDRSEFQSAKYIKAWLWFVL